MEYKNGGMAVPAGGGSNGNVIAGYASVWGPDQVGDNMLPGAFTETLRQKDQVPLLWQHKTDEPLGRVFLMNEDDKGLFFKARIEDTRRGKDALALIGGQSLSAVSIGYTAKRSRRRGGLRQLQSLELFEISLVTFGAAPGAQLLTEPDALAIGDAEARRAKGFSLSPGLTARYVAALDRALDRELYGAPLSEVIRRAERELAELR